MALNTHQLKYFIRHFFTAKRKGHGVHSPFAYQLCENVFYNEDHFYDFELLDSIREKLLNDIIIIKTEDFGAGSKTFKGDTRKISDIARKGISSKKQSEVLYRISNFLNCNTCIELGTSLGLNTLYLAKVNKNTKVISVEGSKTLSDFAHQLAFNNSVQNIEFINARFENALPALFEKFNTIDFLYMDGNHTYEATITYFNQFILKKSKNSVFIFDDIYWSEGMTKAWEEIKKDNRVTLSLDLFYFGMVFFKPELKEKVDLRLYI